jgi:hypothetical protein
MGMIWNSAATMQMIDTINGEFSTNILKWQGLRSLFDRSNQGHNYDLTTIASNEGLYGGGVAGSQHDLNWQAWLGHLGVSTDPPTSNHEKLRKAIYDGLDDTKYDSIFFQVVPLAHGTKIKVSTYPDTDDRLMAILVETPTYNQVAKSVRKAAKKRRTARAKAKAKAKSKGKKKA